MNHLWYYSIISMKSQDLAKKKMPSGPGVYFWKQGKTILYIGKATSLRSRIRSYFASDLIKTRGQSIVDMVFKAKIVTWQETDSVLEALILEAELIKKYQPKYNVKEKDNKSFNYVVITKEAMPQVLLVRGRNLKVSQDLKKIKAQYVFGPFTSGGMLKESLRIIRKIFPFVDNYSVQEDKYEFYKQLGLTPDTKNMDAQVRYKKNIRHIVLFFKGKKKEILRKLEKEMMMKAKQERFEEAQYIKKQIFALTHINDIALMKYDSSEYQHIGDEGFRIESYDVAHISGSSMVGVMTVSTNGVIDKTEYKRFIVKSVSKSNDPKALEEILMRRFRHTEWGVPNIVVVDGGEIQRSVALRVLKFYQLAIPVIAVVKNEKHKAKALIGDENLIQKYKRLILVLNGEAHRFAITFHRARRSKEFIHK